MSVVVFFGTILSVIIALSVLGGVFFAFFLRSYHDKPNRVGMGGAIWCFLYVILCQIPMQQLPEVDDTLSTFVSAVLAQMPGYLFLIALVHFKLYRRLPFLGGPMEDFWLAMRRREEYPTEKEYLTKKEKQLIEKLQAERGYVFPRK